MKKWGTAILTGCLFVVRLWFKLRWINIRSGFSGEKHQGFVPKT